MYENYFRRYLASTFQHFVIFTHTHTHKFIKRHTFILMVNFPLFCTVKCTYIHMNCYYCEIFNSISFFVIFFVRWKHPHHLCIVAARSNTTVNEPLRSTTWKLNKTYVKHIRTHTHICTLSRDAHTLIHVRLEPRQTSDHSDEPIVPRRSEILISRILQFAAASEKMKV